MDQLKHDLEAIGWNSFFQDKFTDFKEDGLIPGRISEVQRKNYIVFTELGEIASRVSGKLRFEADEKSN